MNVRFLSVRQVKEMLDAGYDHIPDYLVEQLRADPRRAVQELYRLFRQREQRTQEEHRRLLNMFRYEQQLYSQGFQYIAGVDEAGRGPLAGPVLAAAVILPLHLMLPGLNDSKLVPSLRRQRLESQIKDTAVAWSVGLATVEEIDAINILEASRLAMHRAIRGLSRSPHHLLVDGLPLPRATVPQTPLIGGDGLSASIAAASILAKVERDRIMDFLDGIYPGYGFAVHRGYPTREHLKSLGRMGPTPVHRQTFRGVKDWSAIGSKDLEKL
ncbi:MAG: ribonuclease HII [Bacillota bacterium]